MNIEKLKNYNQTILAILGSLGVILMIIFIIMAFTEFIRTSSYRHHDDTQVIVSNEKAQDNFKHNKRTHQISFENCELIDTIKGIYLIPVSQTALELKEVISKSEINSPGSLGLISYGGKYANFNYGDESFNNALLYDSRNGSIKQLFDTRISINRIYREKINNKAYVFMAVTKNDTNKDGILNEQDYKTLFVYSATDNKMKEIKSDQTDFNQYYIVANKEQIIIKYGLDKNNDGTHQWDEPLIMKTYSLLTDKLEDFVDKDLYNKLQGLLDGKN